MASAQIGLIGLAVMGENLARNIERNGFPIAVYNRSAEKTREFMQRFGAGSRFGAAESLADFVGLIERPRKIIMMVKAGAPVDALIDQLVPLLAPGDILIDGGNSYFEDTERRAKSLGERGFHFIGSGVSGGEEGALWGPSLMPGGARAAYDQIAPIWTKIAAQVDDGPCCAYIGEGGAGHYVKMVHNGIEYGDMQLIAEAYDLLRTTLGMKAGELADVFAEWNAGLLQSFLVEITAKIFKKTDEETGKPLVDLILDKAGQKGTGKWTVASALDLGIPAPTLGAAVDARVLSSMKDERVEAAKALPAPQAPAFAGDRRAFIDGVRDALYASKICSYAQGMALIQAAGAARKWSLDLGEISRIWKGGCIIRAQFLDRIKDAYRRRAGLPNLLLDSEFKAWIAAAAPAWRRAVVAGVESGVALPAMSASLAYYDAYRRASLPQNLTQAQRDFFGAHTFERADKPEAGFVHADWE